MSGYNPNYNNPQSYGFSSPQLGAHGPSVQYGQQLGPGQLPLQTQSNFGMIPGQNQAHNQTSSLQQQPMYAPPGGGGMQGAGQIGGAQLQALMELRRQAQQAGVGGPGGTQGYVSPSLGHASPLSTQQIQSTSQQYGVHQQQGYGSPNLGNTSQLPYHAPGDPSHSQSQPFGQQQHQLTGQITPEAFRALQQQQQQRSLGIGSGGGNPGAVGATGGGAGSATPTLAQATRDQLNAMSEPQRSMIIKQMQEKMRAQGSQSQAPASSQSQMLASSFPSQLQRMATPPQQDAPLPTASQVNSSKQNPFLMGSHSGGGGQSASTSGSATGTLHLGPVGLATLGSGSNEIAPGSRSTPSTISPSNLRQALPASNHIGSVSTPGSAGGSPSVLSPPPTFDYSVTSTRVSPRSGLIPLPPPAKPQSRPATVTVSGASGQKGSAPSVLPQSTRRQDSSSFMGPATASEVGSGNSSDIEDDEDDKPLAQRKEDQSTAEAARKRKREEEEQAKTKLKSKAPEGKGATIYFAGLEPKREGAGASVAAVGRGVDGGLGAGVGQSAGAQRVPVQQGTSVKGLLRQELSKLMWAAGDVTNPRSDTVDMMQDLLGEFLGDLCHPVPPVRPAPLAPHALPKLTPEIVRYRLTRSPRLRTYLARWDFMQYMGRELASAKRAANDVTTNYGDLVAVVGADYLGVDESGLEVAGPGDGAGPNAGSGKRRGRRPGQGRGAAQGGEGGEDGPRRKPGPKKGWKKEKERMAAEAAAAAGVEYRPLSGRGGSVGVSGVKGEAASPAW